MKLGVTVRPTQSIVDAAETARLIEDLGYQSAWIADHYFHREAAAALALMMTATNELTLGTAVMSPLLRHPTLLASLAATLREIAPTSIPVTASHCVSLGQQPPDVVDEVAELLAHRHIRVVALSATNLYLQNREARSRSLPPIDRLLSAGVQVAAGGDNVQDPFNPTGRLDPLDTANLLVLAAHLPPEQALALVTDAGRVVLDRPPAGPILGAQADLVALQMPALGDPIATAGPGRSVWRRGRLVAETRCTIGGPIASWSDAGPTGPVAPPADSITRPPPPEGARQP